MIYTVSTRTELAKFTVEADTYGQAAQLAARELNRRANGTIPRGLVAERTTGDHKLSGWFQGYIPHGPNALNSYGEAFHVS